MWTLESGGGGWEGLKTRTDLGRKADLEIQRPVWGDDLLT